MTGSFDGWSKSEKLERAGDVFEKTVTLPDTSEPVLYKVSRFRILYSFPKFAFTPSHQSTRPLFFLPLLSPVTTFVGVRARKWLSVLLPAL